MSRLKKIAKWVGGILAVLIVVVVGAGFYAHEPRPDTGTTGEAADALARKVQGAVGQSAWEATGAVRFDFGGRNRHLWDRRRGLAYVTWGDLPSRGGASDAGTTEVWLRLGDRSGVAKVHGERVDGADADELLESAWKRHINDTFWLYPFRTFFDEGVTRSVVDGKLLIEYASGGATPGDAYLWHLDDAGRPTRWEMWVSIIPVGGIGATWSGWERSATGVSFATEHTLGPMTLALEGIETAETAAELAGGADPFAVLHSP